MSTNSSNTDTSKPSEIHKSDLDSTILSLIESTGLVEIDFFNVYDNLNEQDRKQLVNKLFHWIVSNKTMRYYDSKYINYTIGVQSNYRFGDFDKRVAENRLPELMESLHDDKLLYRATVCWVERKKAEIDTFKSQLQQLRNEYYDSVPSEHIDETPVQQVKSYQFPKHLIDTDFTKIDFDNSYRVSYHRTLQELKSSFSKQLQPLETVFDSENYLAFLYNAFQFKNNNTSPTPLLLNPNCSRGHLKHCIYKLYEGFKSRIGSDKHTFGKSVIINFSDDRPKIFNDDFCLETHLKNITKSLKPL